MKLFFLLLEHMNWRVPNNSPVITVENEELKKRLGRKDKNASSFASYIRRQLKEMRSAKIRLPSSYYKNQYCKEFLLTDFHVNKTYVSITLNSHFLQHFSDLIPSKQYVTYWIPDILGFHSKYSIYLYIALRTMQKYVKGAKITGITEVDFGTRQLKTLFDLTIDDYMRWKSGERVFDRFAFEKRTIKVALDEISQSKLIQILPPEKNAPGETCDLYRKTRNGKNVSKYYIRFRVREEILK